MKEAIQELLIKYSDQIYSREDLELEKRALCKKYHLAALPNSDILQQYRILIAAGHPLPERLLGFLRKRAIRTLSGIASVAVLTKPYDCPGSCVYCPHEKNVPTSYLSNEPAVMRAIRCDYNPYQQIIWRLSALENNGHQPSKIELIVIGGTWSYLPDKYKYWYILNCFRAANDYQKIKTKLLKQNDETLINKGKFLNPFKQNLTLTNLRQALKKEQTKNEIAAYKIIGVTLETRPDYISEKELKQMRELGCTRVEIGVQIIDDKILKINRRGHDVAAITLATKLLRQYGFKVTYHLMPALPGATPQKDLECFKRLFTDARFQPDQIKFYPTVVTAGSLLYRWYLQGKYKPYSDKVLQKLIVACKEKVPTYVRIIRLIRDIPGESIIAGNKITNLRQIMKERGVLCRCIRCREAKELKLELKYKLQVFNYSAAGGQEYFISIDSFDNQTLFGFCRLRIDFMSPIAPAIIRELHVYGELVPVGANKKTQHSGLGKKLMKHAEEIAHSLGVKKIAVISGVGARSYYRKLGYHLQNTYMIKKL